MSIGAPTIIRKIQCPGNFMIPPTVDVWLREPVPELQGVSLHAVVKHKLKRDRIVRNAWGDKQVDWKKVHRLEKAGIVKWPWLTAKFAIEHVYDPISVLCRQCDKRCLDGQGQINLRAIKRLNGHYAKTG